jgi:hypothetical protein
MIGKMAKRNFKHAFMEEENTISNCLFKLEKEKNKIKIKQLKDTIINMLSLLGILWLKENNKAVLKRLVKQTTGKLTNG